MTDDTSDSAPERPVEERRRVDMLDSAELTLDDVILLLEREVERLKESLETYRSLDHPQKTQIIRWHVRRLDERQDRLDELKSMLRARRGLH